MCAMCDDPTLTHAGFLARMARISDTYGWAVQGVERNRTRPPWAYTVGLTSHDRPELLITGLPLSRSAELLDRTGAHLLHEDATRPGEQMRLVHGPQVELVAVEHPDVHLLTAVALHGPAVRGQQMVWADDRDQWPWERGFRGRRGGQPVVGPRSVR